MIEKLELFFCSSYLKKGRIYSRGSYCKFERGFASFGFLVVYLLLKREKIREKKKNLMRISDNWACFVRRLRNFSFVFHIHRPPCPSKYWILERLWLTSCSLLSLSHFSSKIHLPSVFMSEVSDNWERVQVFIDPFCLCWRKLDICI